MTHEITLSFEKALELPPIDTGTRVTRAAWMLVAVGVVAFGAGILWYPPAVFWGSFHANVFLWTGLCSGALVLPAIFQVVGARWPVPIRRVVEANVAFLPFAWLAVLITWFGKDYLFPWGQAPFPGREWWMQPTFVYARHALALGILFLLMWRFVRHGLRADLGLLREKAKHKLPWSETTYDGIVGTWRGSENELGVISRSLARQAPLLIILYAIVYSLFAFEMLMAMDKVFFSNLFGGFIFIGNIYLGLAAVSASVIFLSRMKSHYADTVTTQQLWDLGKLTFAFCMLWGYLMFSQFLPIWYANLPETAPWMILRTRELPWKALAWITLGLCFVIPFILLLSRDLKKTPIAFRLVCLIIFAGMWCQMYLVIMPSLSPGKIPFSLLDLGLCAGFAGIYILAIAGFLRRYPCIPVALLSR